MVQVEPHVSERWRTQKLLDPRRAVKEVPKTVTKEDLLAPLPGLVSRQSMSSMSDLTQQKAKPAELTGLLGCGFQLLLRAALQICIKEPKEVKPQPLPAPRRWYRIHPITNTLYFVRPDAGLRGRIPGYPDPNFSEEGGDTPSPARQPSVSEIISDELPVRSRRKQARRPSLPAELERGLGLAEHSLHDLLDNTCRICFDRKSKVIVLPCRHGGCCEECIRRHLFSKPAHKGGRSCPMCRRRIREVIRIYDEAVFPQYGYAIKADTFDFGSEASSG